MHINEERDGDMKISQVSWIQPAVKLKESEHIKKAWIFLFHELKTDESQVGWKKLKLKSSCMKIKSFSFFSGSTLVYTLLAK